MSLCMSLARFVGCWDLDTFNELPSAVPPENSGSGTGTRSAAMGNGNSSATANGVTAGTSGAAATGNIGDTNDSVFACGTGDEEDDYSVMKVYYIADSSGDA